MPVAGREPEGRGENARLWKVNRMDRYLGSGPSSEVSSLFAQLCSGTSTVLLVLDS